MLSQGKFYYSQFYKGSYIPKSGDLVFYTSDYGASSQHVGMVTKVEGNTVYTVEGNTGESYTSPYWMGSSVMERSYSLNNSWILGYYPMN